VSKNPTKKIAAVLWDNDGVLVDTEALFETLGITLSLNDFAEINLRQGNSVMRHHTQAIGMSDEEIAKLHKVRDGRYTDLLNLGVEKIPGVENALELLRPHARQAVVTSSLPKHFHLIHETTGLKKYFEFFLTRDHYKLAKPNPEPYLTAAKKLGVSPEKCVVIEDTERGLSAAKNAGMACLVIPNPLATVGDFSDADAVVASPTEAAQLIIERYFL